MIKKINLPPYHTMEIRNITEEGLICSLFGDNHFDTNILIPKDSEHYVELTEEEIKQIKENEFTDLFE